MATLTTTDISIGGKTIPSYAALTIHQSLGDHNTVNLSCRADVVEQLSEQLIGGSKDFLGEVITIRIVASENYSQYREFLFKGVVTKVETLKQHHQSGNHIALTAMSTSILAEDGQHTSSYLELGLAEILDATFSGYDVGKLETAFTPRQSDTIHYSVQKNESNFAYASRLAATTNNWFYYDGVKLVFGTPSNEETSLVYGRDLTNFGMRLEPLPNKSSHHTYDYLTGEHYQKNSSESTSLPSGYHSLTSNKANNLYPKTNNQYHQLHTDQRLQQRFERQVENHTHAITARQVIASGVSDNPGVQLGTIIYVEGYGRFRIISVTHGNIEGGLYKNQFEAIAADIDVYPLMNMFDMPISTIEMGEVIDNVDPQGLSRVKVRFPFQKYGGTTTPWIPVVTPYAGADKGFHFIPEIGETVVCQFENNCAERPYVTGSIYHGQAQPSRYQSDANNIKAIRTRSGHTIELNDTEGREMITISDRVNNLISLDTANGCITISAPEEMILRSKNLSIEVAEDMNINVSGFKNEYIAKDHSVTATNLYHTADENMETKATHVETNADQINANSSKENLELNSAKQVVNNSNDKIKLF
ncbi:type VI secretion system Vgr family protein [Aquimarina hainanensis]|uniref:Type VI secretion system Vgr family protein n=1 Tax=Aquimarina hainanensis TaxID=1578017 RepID=A0ABW5N3M8_9FLAO